MKTTLKNKFINPKLFVQGLLQLKVAGIATIVCSTIYTILLPIIAYIESRSNIDKYNSDYRLLDISEHFFPLMAVLYIITPIMSILLFRFMHKRSSSDFYHSIPVKRSCIFFSYMASIVTWVTIIILVFSTTLCLMTTIFLPEYVLDMPNIIMYNVNMIIACVLMAGVFGIGLSITGTVFSGYVTSMIILIAPRLLIAFFCNMIAGLNPQIISDGMAFFTRNDCNMALSPIMYIFNEGYYGYNVSSIPYMGFGFGTIYSIFLAVIYLCIGLLAFTKRPSEAAGKAYSHKIFNFITKLSIGYVITLFIVYIMVETEEYFSTTYLIIFAFALLAMFVYEVILSKSIKRGLKSFLSTPILIVLDVVTIACIFTVSHFIKNERFDADDIDYIRLDYGYTDFFDTYTSLSYDEESQLYSNDITMINSGSSNYADIEFYMNALKNYEITNREVIEYVVKLYNNWCDRNDDRDDYIPYYVHYDNYLDIKLTIGDAFSDTERILYLNSTQLKNIALLLSKKTDVNTYIQNSIPDSASDLVLDCDGLTYEQIEAIYDVLVEEYKALSPSTFTTFLEYDVTVTDYVNIIEGSLYVKDEIEYIELPITSLTPKAFYMYLSYYNNNHKDDVLALIDKIYDHSSEYKASMSIGAISATWSNDGAFSWESPFSKNTYYEQFNPLYSTGLLKDDATEYLTGEHYNDFSNYGSDGYYLAYIGFEVYKKTGESDYYYGEYTEYLGKTGFYMMLNEDSDADLIEEIQQIEPLYAK